MFKVIVFQNSFKSGKLHFTISSESIKHVKLMKSKAMRLMNTSPNWKIVVMYIHLLLLAPRVAKGFDETNKKMESKGSRGAMCIARLMKFDGVFGPRLRRCVCVSLIFGLKSYVACFIIQSKFQN